MARWGVDWATAWMLMAEYVRPASSRAARALPSAACLSGLRGERLAVIVRGPGGRRNEPGATGGVAVAFATGLGAVGSRIVPRPVGGHRSWRAAMRRPAGAVKGRVYAGGCARPGEPAGCRCCSRPAGDGTAAGMATPPGCLRSGRRPTGHVGHVAAALGPASVGDLARAARRARPTRGRTCPADREQSGSARDGLGRPLRRRGRAGNLAGLPRGRRRSRLLPDRFVRPDSSPATPGWTTPRGHRSATLAAGRGRRQLDARS